MIASDYTGPVFIFAGIVAILTGIFGKTFYEGDALPAATYKRERRMTTRWGKSIFIVCVTFLEEHGGRRIRGDEAQHQQAIHDHVAEEIEEMHRKRRRFDMLPDWP